MPKIKQQCGDCSGTGLYSGFCEAPDEAVVCVPCQGRGWVEHRYKEFTGRKKRRGVKRIRLSQGCFIPAGVGGKGKHMTYEEFEKKVKVGLDVVRQHKKRG